MKLIHFLAPVLALAICGTWIGSQRRSIANLERQSSLLRKEIEARKTGDPADDAGSRSSVPGKETKNKGPVDWKKIAAKLEESRNGGGMGDMRTMMRLNQRLMAMSRDELVAALDEIASLDLSETSRSMLENILIGPLIEKDPEFVLARFSDRINAEHGGMHWQLSRAFGEWAKKDPAAATAWFDQQIAAGTFESKSLDGESRQRIQFEGTIIGTLLGSNPEAASLRIAALPEVQRRDVLRSHATNSLKEEDQLAYAKLVRQSLDEKEGQECIARLASDLSYRNDDYSVVTECMNRIEATPAERAACVEESAENRFQELSHQRKITRDDIEKMREWAKSQSPEIADRATGKALAKSLQRGGKMEFSDVAALATEYHAASGSDEVLIPLLNDWQSRQNENIEQARVLAGKISDEKVRNEILRKLEPKAEP
jgi:hypothetical protein